MRPLLLLVLTAVLLGSAAGAARADDAVPPPRLDTLAAQLRDAPLAVDDDLASYLSAAERARLRRELEASAVPVRVALVPAIDEDESGGDPYRQLEGLAKRVGEPGVYVVVDQDGQFEIAGVRVARDLRVESSLLRGYELGEDVDEGADTPATTIVERVEEVVAAVEAAPPGEAEAFTSSTYRRDELDDAGPAVEHPTLEAVAWFSALGLLAGGMLYLVTAGVLAVLGLRRA